MSQGSLLLFDDVITYNKPMSDVIVALATPPIKGALAVIRSSGDGVFDLVQNFFNRNILNIKEKTIFTGKISENGKDIDMVVLLAYPKPATSTGEDVVEIICHGSMVIVNEIIECYLRRGARYATRGEFSSRAYLNGKMDLVEAEAVNDLINATTIESKNISLDSLEGKTSKLVSPLKESLSALLALVEVNIDYPEYEDIEQINKERIVSTIDAIREDIKDKIKKGKEGNIIRNGIKLAIVGLPNVGKSSLLNAFVGQSKAIVSDIPGTTRDVVEGDINIKGIPIHLLDTAGLRDKAEKIEELGIEKTKETINSADVVVLVVDARNGLTKEEKEIINLATDKKVIIAYNKTDLVKERTDGVNISALNGDIEELKDAIYKSLGLSEESFSSPSLSSARVIGLLKHIDECLAEAKNDCVDDAPIDLISVNLLDAYNACREILGENPTRDLTDEIFSRFCVGK